MQRADGHHRHGLRIDVAGDDGLKCHHEAGRRDDRVGRLVRHRAVPADAGQRDGGVIARRHRRPFPERQLTLRQAGHVVHGEDGIAGIPVEQPVLHHAQGAATALFRRLEDEVQHAVEAAGLREAPRRRQQHRGVPVMAAGMHEARPAAAPGRARGLLDGQRIHVGAQAEAPAAGATHEAAHHAGAADAPLDLVAPGFELVGHERCGAVLLEGQLRLAVDVAPQGDELPHLRPELVQQVGGRFGRCRLGGGGCLGGWHSIGGHGLSGFAKDRCDPRLGSNVGARKQNVQCIVMACMMNSLNELPRFSR